MCEKKNSDGKHVWACGKCGQCIQAKKNDWVARAMAETAVKKYTTVVTLTYRNNKDGSKPMGASTFVYKQVQDFFKSVRNAAAALQAENPGTPDVNLTYIVCGERGSRFDRVHWHLILWSDIDITALGKFSMSPGGKRLLEVPFETNVQWDRWPHGHVYLEQPHEASIAYLLKYALKTQWNSERSKGQTRFTKSDWHAAGMFRMSKVPPIGLTFLQTKLAHWSATNTVPVSLNLKVPGYKGFWFPKRHFRERLTYGLHEIAERVKRETGRYPATYNALLASVKRPVEPADERLKEPEFQDYERIRFGEETQADRLRVSDSDAERLTREMAAKTTERAKRQKAANIKFQCGGLLPCWKCANGLLDEAQNDVRDWVAYWQKQSHQSRSDVETWYIKHQNIRANPWCIRKSEKVWRDIFNARGKSKFVKDAQQKMQTATRQSES